MLKLKKNTVKNGKFFSQENRIPVLYIRNAQGVYLVLNFPGAVLRRQMSGLQTPILHGRGNLKATGISRFFFFFFFGAIFPRFLLLISSDSAGDFTIACAEGGKDSSVIAISCSTSCAISVAEVSIFVFGLTVLFGGVFVSISFSTSVDGLESFSIFRLTNFFMDGATFTDIGAKSSSSSYLCFSCENVIKYFGANSAWSGKKMFMRKKCRKSRR